jgi:DNA-binding transcriptional LysR family regulator
LFLFQVRVAVIDIADPSYRIFGLEPEPPVERGDRGDRSATIGPAEERRFIRQVDWNLFRQFYEIVQSGSLSAAARRLNLHQPTLSAALKRLEGHLGATLCRRTSQGIELTPAGKALMRLTADMVESVRLAPHLTSQAAKRVEGSLSIRMITYIVCAELDEALASIHRRHPNVEITLEVAPWRDVLEAVTANQCDIGVTYDSGPRPQLRYEPLFRETQQLYCGRSHPLYGQSFREPSSLSQEQFILTHGDEPEALERFRQHYSLGRNTCGHAEDLHEATRLIELGIGVGFLPTIVAKLGGVARLWPLLNPSTLPSYFIYLVAPPPARVSTPTQLFLDEMRRRLMARGDAHAEEAERQRPSGAPSRADTTSTSRAGVTSGV